jgi:arsenate reductase
MEMWHNPRCSKCAAARSALDEAGIDYVLRDYLAEPPSEEELERLLDRAGLQPWDVTRWSEPLARELGLEEADRDRRWWIRVLVQHPILIQRPIIVLPDGQAMVARTPESLQEVTAVAQRLH